MSRTATIDFDLLDLPEAMLKRVEASKREAERELWESIVKLHRSIMEEVAKPDHNPEEVKAAQKLKAEMLAELGIPIPEMHRLRLVESE